MKLSKQQVIEVKKELIENGTPCKFFINKQNIEIVNGNVLPKGINTIYQYHYYSFTKKTAKKIASWLGAKVYFLK